MKINKDKKEIIVENEDGELLLKFAQSVKEQKLDITNPDDLVHLSYALFCGLEEALAKLEKIKNIVN